MEVSKKAFDLLNDEAKERLRACETPEDILAFAKAEGVELSDEDLEGIAGGVDWLSCTAVNCGPGIAHSS